MMDVQEFEDGGCTGVWSRSKPTEEHNYAQQHPHDPQHYAQGSRSSPSRRVRLLFLERSHPPPPPPDHSDIARILQQVAPFAGAWSSGRSRCNHQVAILKEDDQGATTKSQFSAVCSAKSQFSAVCSAIVECVTLQEAAALFIRTHERRGGRMETAADAPTLYKGAGKNFMRVVEVFSTVLSEKVLKKHHHERLNFKGKGKGKGKDEVPGGELLGQLEEVASVQVLEVRTEASHPSAPVLWGRIDCADAGLQCSQREGWLVIKYGCTRFMERADLPTWRVRAEFVH